MDEKLVNVYPYSKLLDEEIAEIKTLHKLTNMLFGNSRLHYFRYYFYRTDDPRFEFNEKNVLLDKLTIINSMRILIAVVGLFIISMAFYILWYQDKNNISISITPIFLLFGIPALFCFYLAFKKHIVLNFHKEKLQISNKGNYEYEITEFYYTDIHDALILKRPYKESRLSGECLVLILKNNTYHRIELNEIDSKKVAYNIQKNV